MIYPLLIILTVLISYWRSLRGGYIVDDEDTFNLKVTPKNKWQKFWWQVRGVKYSDPQAEHLISLTIHLINCLLVYFAFGHNQISFYAAMLFAVNPAGTQGSVWLSGKGYSLCTASVLLMWWLCPLFYMITPYLAFNGFLAPLLFIRTQWWWVVLIPISLRLAKGERKHISGRLSVATGKGREFSIKKIIVSLKTLGYYTCLAVFPARLGIYHQFLYTYSLSDADNKHWEKIDKYFWVGCLVIGILFYGWFWYYNQAVFGLYWFVLLLFVWLNIISLNQSIAERYLYLPLIGMMYCLANILPDYLILALFVAYWVRLQLHIPAYDNINNCFEYGKLNFPDCYVYYTWEGQVHKRQGRFFMALEAWMQGYKMRPTDFRLNNNIAVMLTDMGYLTDAEAFLKNAEDNLIPEQKEAAQKFLAHEKARIVTAREILKKKAIAERIRR